MHKQNRMGDELRRGLAEVRARLSDLEGICAQIVWAEDELRESEEKYSTAVEQLTDALLITQDGKFKFVNKAVERIYGYTVDEMMGMPLLKTVAPEYISFVQERLKAKKEGKEVASSYEARIQCRDGTTKDVEVSVRFIQYQGDIATMSIVRDITERKGAEAKILQRGKELAALHKALMSIIRTLDLDKTLREIARQVGAAVGSTHTCIAVVNQDNTISLGGEDTNGTVSAFNRRRLNKLTQEIIARGQPEFVTDLSAGESRKSGVESGSIRSWAGVPIRAKSSIIGVLFVHSGQPDAFKGRTDLLAAFADQAAIAIDNARLYDTVKAERARVEQLLGKVLTAQEDERRRLSLDLHDTVTQSMYGVLARIGAAQQLLSRSSPEEAGIELGHAKEAMEQTLLDVRRVAANLHPPALDKLGLAQALCHLSADFSRNNGGLVCSFETEGEPRRLPPRVEIGAYRVVQEALSNVRRHAVANRVVVRVVFLADRVCLSISDDGKGFDFSGGTASELMVGRLGLAGMTERAELIGAALEVQTSPGKGTTVKMTIPVELSDHFEEDIA